MKHEFQEIMAEQTKIALATSDKNQPNVRIVNFAYDDEANCLYFSTFGDNVKRKEIAENPKVSVTTVPDSGTKHVRIHQGVAKESSLSIYDVATLFTKKIPHYADTINFAGDSLVLYEIHFNEAIVILDMNRNGLIKF